MTAQIFDFATQEVWNDIDLLLNAHPQIVRSFKDQLNNAEFNAVAESQNHPIAHDNRVEIKAGDVVFPGTEIAEGLAMTFMGEAKDGVLLGTIKLDDESEKYQKAILLSPNNVTAIKGAAECLLEQEDYGGAKEMFVRLAFIAKDRQELDLAQYVLDQAIIENVLLSIKPMSTETLKPAGVVLLFK